MGFRGVLTGAFALIGIITTAAVAVGLINNVIPPIKKKKTKNTCSHIWVVENSKKGHIHTEYDLKCEMCGEKQHIDIWERWDKVDENGTN